MSMDMDFVSDFAVYFLTELGPWPRFFMVLNLYSVIAAWFSRDFRVLIIALALAHAQAATLATGNVGNPLWVDVASYGLIIVASYWCSCSSEDEIRAGAANVNWPLFVLGSHVVMGVVAFLPDLHPLARWRILNITYFIQIISIIAFALVKRGAITSQNRTTVRKVHINA